MAKLCLGTVQFGMKYGINNTDGQPSIEDSFSMLDTALESGEIDTIDTARAYGQAEEILGKYFSERKNSGKVKIISKLRPNVIEDGSGAALNTVESELIHSLKTVGVDHFDGYLLHTPEYIYRKDILDAMVRMKERGLVRNIGVSIYNMEEGFAAIKSGVVDYIQVPYSILDQRAVKTDFIKQAKTGGIKIFARSAFLQGLFMMEPDRIPEHLKRAVPYIDLFNEVLQKYHADRIDALIHFVVDEPDIDYLVFGVDSKTQLTQDIESYKNCKVSRQLIDEIKQQITDIDDSIILPSLWSNGKKAE